MPYNNLCWGEREEWINTLTPSVGKTETKIPMCNIRLIYFVRIISSAAKPENTRWCACVSAGKRQRCLLSPNDIKHVASFILHSEINDTSYRLWAFYTSNLNLFKMNQNYNLPFSILKVAPAPATSKCTPGQPLRLMHRPRLPSTTRPLLKLRTYPQPATPWQPHTHSHIHTARLATWRNNRRRRAAAQSSPPVPPPGALQPTHKT